jgi:hypothetical protein
MRQPGESESQRSDAVATDGGREATDGGRTNDADTGSGDVTDADPQAADDEGGENR